MNWFQNDIPLSTWCTSSSSGTATTFTSENWSCFRFVTVAGFTILMKVSIEQLPVVLSFKSDEFLDTQPFHYLCQDGFAGTDIWSCIHCDVGILVKYIELDGVLDVVSQVFDIHM